MTEEQKELVTLALTEKGDNKPGLVQEMLRDLQEAMPGLFVDLSGSGRAWLRGKSAQETAKAQQILSEVIDRIGRLRLEECEQDHRQVIEQEKHKMELEKQRLELYLTALERAAKIASELADAGIDVDITAILSGIPMNITSIASVPDPQTDSNASTQKLESK